MIDIFVLILFAAAIIFAFLAMTADKSMNSIAFMVFATIAIGLLYMYVGATYVGIFQLIVYSGVLSVLFASTEYMLQSEPINARGKLEVGP